MCPLYGLDTCRRITSVELRRETCRSALVGRGLYVMPRLLGMLRSERKYSKPCGFDRVTPGYEEAIVDF